MIDLIEGQKELVDLISDFIRGDELERFVVESQGENCIIIKDADGFCYDVEISMHFNEDE